MIQDTKHKANNHKQTIKALLYIYAYEYAHLCTYT